MAMPVISKPLYPNVPQAPGVPPLVRRVGEVQNTVVALASDAVRIANLFAGPQWGIFYQDTYAPALTADSVVGMDFRKEWRVSDYPVEGGGFASYNKVETPFDIRVSLASSGTLGGLLGNLLGGGGIASLLGGGSPAATRGEFLTALGQVAAQLVPLVVITPEINYKSCNLVHYDFRRKAESGVTLIVVDLWLIEIRQPAAAQFIKVNGQTQPVSQTQGGGTASPAGAAQTNDGTVQGGALSTSQQGSLPPGTGSGGGTEPYYNANGQQIGIAPSNTPASGPIVGYYGNRQPVVGGTWQGGFYDQGNNWVNPAK